MLDKQIEKNQVFTVNKPRGATSINPATLLFSEVSNQPGEEEEWEFVTSGESQLMGKTTKSVEYTENGVIYVYPVGAKVLLTAYTDRGPGNRYTARFIGEGILKQHSTQGRTHRRTQSGGKHRSTKNRRSRSRSTRRNKRR